MLDRAAFEDALAFYQTNRPEIDRYIAEYEEGGTPSRSFDEIVALYSGEWILLRVTAVEGGWPSHGEVLAHDASRTTITDAWADAVRSKKPDDRYYMFPACDAIRTGAELREALAVLRETWDEDLQKVWEGEVGRAWRRW